MHGGGPAALGRFPGSARLKRKRLIAPLFDRDDKEVRTASAGNIRVLFRLAPREHSGTGAPVQVGFAVPRRIRRATDRNRIKRLMRAGFQSEADRFLGVPVPDDRTLTMMAVYRGDRDAVDVAGNTRLAFERAIRTLD